MVGSLRSPGAAAHYPLVTTHYRLLQRDDDAGGDSEGGEVDADDADAEDPEGAVELAAEPGDLRAENVTRHEAGYWPSGDGATDHRLSARRPRRWRGGRR